jgi:arylformamidase
MSPYRLIDVSMWMDEFAFPGDPALDVSGPFNRIAGENPEYVYDFREGTQSGTHVQGPHYFMASGKRIDEFPLEAFEGWAHVVDIGKRGEDTTAADLEELIGNRKMTGEIVILRTGHMGEVIRTGRLNAGRRPGLSLDAARYLVEHKGISMVGIDSVGLESRRTSNYEVNVYLCQQNVLIFEGLVNLRAISRERVFSGSFSDQDAWC